VNGTVIRKWRKLSGIKQMLRRLKENHGKAGEEKKS